MPQTLYHVGCTTCSVVDMPVSFKGFGSKATVSDEIASKLLATGENGHRPIPVVTESEFNSLGVTDAKLVSDDVLRKAWAMLHKSPNAPDDIAAEETEQTNG